MEENQNKIGEAISGAIKEETVQQGGQEDNSQQQSVPLDLDTYGDLEVKTGGSKPKFDKVTKARIVDAELMSQETKKTEEKKDGNTFSYYPVYLKVNFAVDDRDQPVYENYSGGRLFVSEDKGSRLWVGPQSSLGKLIGVVNEYFDFSGKLRELPDKLKGQIAGIKTEEMNVGGETYYKNVIKQFMV